ncbi:MAG: sulfur carrier protein ThiS [Clostridia bacterium]|nr:sulfur carrier protein ThiS [Clostridia bacterium]
MIRINGEDLDVAGKSVAEYLDFAGYDLTRVAVELNGDIVPKEHYAETIFKDGDSVEVVSFVGGG